MLTSSVPFLRSIFFRFLILLAVLFCQNSFVQTTAVGAMVQEDDGENVSLREEVEPGIFVFGRPHRFAEIGRAGGFDSSPDGRTLVFSGAKLKFFDLVENKVVEEASVKGEYYQAVSYSPDGRYVFAQSNTSGKPIVRIFDAIDKSPVGTIKVKNYFQTMAISPDASFVATSNNNLVEVFDVSSGEQLFELSDLGYLQSLAFSPDESSLIVPKNGRIQMVDMKTG